MKNFVFVILLLFVAIASALFFAQNDELTQIRYFGQSIDLKLNWILISMIMIGFCLGVLSTLSSLIAGRLRLVLANKRVRKLEIALENSPNLPTKENH